MIEKSMPDKNLKIMRREVDMLKRESEESKTRIDGLRYLQHVANLPWYHERKQIDLMEAKHILDSSHYGMDEAKNEIIKFLAERALNEEAKGSVLDRKSTRLNSSHVAISYAVFCLKKKNK